MYLLYPDVYFSGLYRICFNLPPPTTPPPTGAREKKSAAADLQYISARSQKPVQALGS